MFDPVPDYRTCCACGFEVEPGDHLSQWHEAETIHGEDGWTCEVCYSAAPIGLSRPADAPSVVPPLSTTQSIVAIAGNMVLRETRKRAWPCVHCKGREDTR